jgi:DNA-binding beta-propeller fold protein YncE
VRNGADTHYIAMHIGRDTCLVSPLTAVALMERGRRCSGDHMRFSPSLRRAARAALVTCGLIAALAGCAADKLAVAPQRVVLSASANGIAVRAGDGAVFITDDQTNSVLSSADARTFAHYANIPAVAGQPNSLSQLSITDDGKLMIARFGFGTASAVFAITGADQVMAFSGPDPSRRRLGLIPIGANRLLSTWFIKNGSHPPQGALSLITYDPNAHTAVERDLLTGLGKPLGIAVSGDTVYVSDQANNDIVKASLSALLAASHAVTPGTPFVRIDGPDLMANAPDGTLYTRCNASSVCRIAPNGTISVLADDFQNARGVAIDAPRGKLYVIDRATHNGSTSYLRSFPLH